MKNRSAKIKLIVIAAMLAATVFLARGERAGAQVSQEPTPQELTPQEKRGKQIYLKGEGGEGGEITAILGSSDLELPASAFSCANCHGLRGEGTKEGGLQPPPLKWAALTSPQVSPLTNRQREPYTEATLARAIGQGIDPSGARLHPGMPHYKMTRDQMADLIAYLKKIGKEADLDAGLSQDTIKIGAALPMSGPLASIGEDAKAALAAYFGEINSQGGIYGRRFELVVEDSRGEPAGTLEATRQLIEQRNVFALVGSFEPGDSAATNEYAQRSEVPLIGPVTLSPRLSTVPNRFVFYLIPSFSDQARSLVDFISLKAADQNQPAARLAVVYSDNDFNQDALTGLKAQAKLRLMEIVTEHGYKAGSLPATAIVSSLVAENPDHVFFFGSSGDFASFAQEAERAKLRAWILSSAVMIGRGVFDLPPSIASRTFLSYPASMPERDDFSEFLDIMSKGGVKLRGAAFQAVAFAAAKVFVEATKTSGRQLSRATLVNRLEQLRNFKIGVLPPVTFGPNRRVGAASSYIVGIDVVNKKYVPMSERIEPQGNRQ